VITVRAPLATMVQQRQEARAVAIEQVQWMRAQRRSLRPGDAVLPVRDFIVERPVTSWEDVTEIYTRAWLHAVAPGRTCPTCGKPTGTPCNQRRHVAHRATGGVL
jgi:hypothetical protein